ncbi:ras-related protein RABD2a-like [Gigantopelta aegis]|uniref:ras-related protein RABD2a-like n=1 Tax=Gigantopelta aegis TaxID=1735272 RepID=UPI001B8897BE|nr:ras-related protein RABD2a-like [Gigantopelta aegis]
MSTSCDSSRARDYDYSVKVVLVGDLGVGKTTFLNTFLDGKYSRSLPHDSRALREKIFQYNGKIVRLQIWDTAGQERYRSLTSSYYRGAHGCIIMFDVTNKSSFENVTAWKRDIHQYCHHDDIGIILVGTKSHKTNREVTRERAEDLARSAKMPYMEVSSDTDHGSVEAVFNNIIDMVASHAHHVYTTSYCHQRTLQKPLKKSWCSC